MLWYCIIVHFFCCVNNYLKYSGIGFQIIGAALLGILLGRAIDNWLEMKQAIFTAILTSLFTAAGIWISLRSFLKDFDKSNKKDRQ